MTAKVISLTSDFGLKDPYVAEMKAVILGICPDAIVVDVTHGVDKFDVLAGAFALASATPYFPSGTIHLAVIDPSVGTTRRPIVVETKQGYFVGPDNGLLFLAAQEQGVKQTRLIENLQFMLSKVSATFHGRDVFAPTAAHLANGVEVEKFGKEIRDPVKPEFSAVKRRESSVEGVALYIDSFGNIITSVRSTDIVGFAEDSVKVAFGEMPSTQVILSRTYADVKPGKAVALVGSHGFIEVSINKGSAAEKFSAKEGDKTVFSKP